MQIKIITLPVLAEEAEQEELNVFLRSHKIVDVRRELAQSADGCYWTFCITFLPSVKSEGRERFSNGEKQSKIYYKDVLDSVSFERFSRMRRLRKEIAESEAIPAYAVFTDAELADMARLEVLDAANIVKIPGIGKKRVEKYGNAFCLIDKTQLDDEKGGESDIADSQS